MLTIQNGSEKFTVALDMCCFGVALTIRDKDGIVFSQAINASDVGMLLDVCRSRSSHFYICGGDLNVACHDGEKGLKLIWWNETGNGSVHLSDYDVIVFEEALRSYCRMLMRTPSDVA